VPLLALAFEVQIEEICLGRTEADRKITNEPWSSMERFKKATTTKTTHSSE
jgi:hypothetical protein